MRSGWVWLAAILLAVAAGVVEASVPDETAGLERALEGRRRPPEACIDCHDGREDAAEATAWDTLLAGSVHGDDDCDSCHESISMDDVDLNPEDPHPGEVEPVDCGGCHDEEAAIYAKHGRLQVGADSDLPECWDCHGAHEILPSDDPRAKTHAIQLPETCRSCHTNVDLVEKHEILREEPIELYRTSVHGRASKKGLYVAATCTDCHSAEGPDGERTAHRIFSAADSESTIFHFNIPETCADCHDSVARDYVDGIHGQLVERGEVDAPVCTDCHGEHGIISPSDPRSPVSAGRMAEATCSPCHESEVLNEKYGIPAGNLRSYIDSYHGLKSKAGDVRVANCASCHGAHRILPHTDLTSSIHPDRLKETCGECHPGISAELAASKIHSATAEARTGWPRFVTVFYIALISVTIGAMFLHNFADWLRYVRNLRKRPYVTRFTLNEALQHWMLAVSFTVLVISGFSLRFGEARWVQLLFGWGEGEGFLMRGAVHRSSAVIFILCGFWHAGFLATRRGRGMLRDMIPARSDLSDLVENILYFMGRRERSARFRRFSYMEKAEYFALIWGGIIMTFTGLLLWFDNWFVLRWALPKAVLDVVLIVHYYEAWLALLAIVVWHGYGTLFSPHVYPMNPAWLVGKMPSDMYAHEHPRGPKLKARVFREIRYEEEGAGEDEPPLDRAVGDGD